ncbi:hypothetical protein [Paenibacillus sp. NAIST15-1]|uniref:hypothetical protein n=1 Tax=Paenibacillus sp. NAIST15-1 TaxID=1605994 RepID=UPI00086E2944|nr:hypothetical protein [Paenibacillus sp. NAIST15-1]GAV11397.1 hypothetical protein PBN151_1326 [Paenibacillus sp. NAIST15-1]
MSKKYKYYQIGFAERESDIKLIDDIVTFFGSVEVIKEIENSGRQNLWSTSKFYHLAYSLFFFSIRERYCDAARHKEAVKYKKSSELENLPILIV